MSGEDAKTLLVAPDLYFGNYGPAIPLAAFPRQWDDYLYVQEDADLGMQDEPDDQATCGVIYNIGPYGGYMYSDAGAEGIREAHRPTLEGETSLRDPHDMTRRWWKLCRSLAQKQLAGGLHL